MQSGLPLCTKMSQNLPDYYEKFLEALKAKGPAQNILVKQLCDLLNLQSRAIYNRLNGETQFTINEAILLCRSYNIDIQEILMPDNAAIMYQSGTIGRKMNRPTDYLELLSQLLLWLSSLKNPRIQYTSHDFPLFLTCHFPRLIKLKLAIWSYYSWELKSFTSTSMFDLDDKEFSAVEELCQKVTKIYSQIPSKEYLPSSLFDNTIYQIQFLIDVEGFFRPNQVKYLIDDLEAEINMMEDQAISGTKNPASINFYKSDMLNQALNFMAEWEDGCRVFTMIDSPNFIYSESPRITQHMKDYFRKIINTSESLTQTNGKERRKYFNHLYQKVKVLRDMNGRNGM